jgi:hypothetical protein
MIELNRVFSGDPNGLLTHHLAYKLFDLSSGSCGFFVDRLSAAHFPPRTTFTFTGIKVRRGVWDRGFCTWGRPNDGSLSLLGGPVP